MKDLVLLAVSFYLLKQDLLRVTQSAAQRQAVGTEAKEGVRV